MKIFHLKIMIIGFYYIQGAELLALKGGERLFLKNCRSLHIEVSKNNFTIIVIYGLKSKIG